MTDRATRWSITWYPPTDSMCKETSTQEVNAYLQRPLAPGWRFTDKNGKITGQLEQCPQTLRYHFQGMLTTPQVRKSAVIAAMDKAHVEVARNVVQLSNYVTKEETRAAVLNVDTNPIPTLFEYQTIIAKRWDWDDYDKLRQAYIAKTNLQDYDEIAMRYIDGLVAEDIESGRRGAEFIAVNPMWRSSWKKFWRSIIKRNGVAQGQTSHGEAGTEGTPAQQVSEGGQWSGEGDEDAGCT